MFWNVLKASTFPRFWCLTNCKSGCCLIRFTALLTASSVSFKTNGYYSVLISYSYSCPHYTLFISFILFTSVFSPCHHKSLTTAVFCWSFLCHPCSVFKVESLVCYSFLFYLFFLDNFIYLPSMCQSCLNLNLQSLDSNFQTSIWLHIQSEHLHLNQPIRNTLLLFISCLGLWTHISPFNCSRKPSPLSHLHPYRSPVRFTS